jgi:hypothetical protein
MPVELHRKIRHATFRPRRHVWSCEDGTGPCCKLVGFAHPPVALSVNKGLDTLRVETNILKAVDLESFARITSRNQLLTSSANFNIWRLRSGVSSLSEVNIIFTDLPKGDPKYFQGLKTLTLVPHCFILWNEEDLKGQNGKFFVEGYEEGFFLFFFCEAGS